ncbi:pumilio homolog 3 [Schistocerca gregaria]|uniref:pumilio homolog 3 n=1 Tax=Schistocerca gregaria TaxID=7010 RepID=UPI00211F4259|nr:pumilio homolog 3 [Schistocerca gregaria]
MTARHTVTKGKASKETRRKLASSKSNQSVQKKKLWERKDLSSKKAHPPFKQAKEDRVKDRGQKKRQRPETDQEADSEHEHLQSRKSAGLRPIKIFKPNAELTTRALRIWNEFAPRTVSQEKRWQLIDELLNLVEGKILEIVYKGTISRVFQSLLKYGSPAHRERLFQALKENVVEMAKNRYAHKLLMRMLKRGSQEQKNFLIGQFYGQVTLLMRHPNAAAVIEYIYESIATPKQRADLVIEFYGGEFVHFKGESKLTLEGILRDHPEKKPTILAHIRQSIMPIINKTDTSAILNHSILHLPLLKLFELDTPANNAVLIGAMKDAVIRLVHSKDGARVACHCIAYGTAKDRKAIIKSMRGYVMRIAKEEFGHLVLLRIFNAVDDTTLVSKYIISELKPGLLELAQDRFGRLSLLYLLSPLNRRYFSEFTLSLLQPVYIPLQKPTDQPSDAVDRVATSLKDPAIRQIQLLNAILPQFVQMVKRQALRLITHTYARDILVETIYAAPSVLSSERMLDLYQSVTQLLGEPVHSHPDEEEEDDTTKHFHTSDFLREAPLPPEDIMTHHLAHRTLRRLVEDDTAFAECTFKKIKDRIFHYATLPFSSWVIYSLLISEATRSGVEEILKPHIDELSQTYEQNQKNKAISAIVCFLTTRRASECASN